MKIHLGVVSLMPEMFDCLKQGITGRALEQGLVRIDCFNPRDWGHGVHRQVDDKPYGGGPGMVMMYEPLRAALDHAKSLMPDACKTVYLTPQGRKISQSYLNELVNNKQSILFVAGRYEGIDERIITHHVDEEWSLGDFVLSGGELAAMVFMDAMIRLIPGSLGHTGSAQQDSFMHGLLDYPHFTRPALVEGCSVPEVLLSGNHQAIAVWRRKQALGQTWLKRKDLLDKTVLTEADEELLEEFKRERGIS